MSRHEWQDRLNREARAAYAAHGYEKPDFSCETRPQEFSGVPVKVHREWDGDDETGSYGKPVQVVEAPDDDEARKLTQADILLSLYCEVPAWCGKDPVRWMAFFVVIGRETRPLPEIAHAEGFSLRLIQTRVAECRKWKDGLVAKMMGAVK